jgi:TRAP-type mannitol/chloroaromatic compound transport system permease small subunit
MRLLLRLVDQISLACAIVACGLALVLIFVTLIEVFMRYVAGTPTEWVFDVAYMVSGASVLLAGGYTLRVDGHVRINFLSSRLPPRVESLAHSLFFFLIMLPALFFISRASWSKSWTAFRTGEVEVVSPWAPVIWPFFTALTIGLVVLSIQVAAEAVRHLLHAISPNDASRVDSNR